MWDKVQEVELLISSNMKILIEKTFLKDISAFSQTLNIFFSKKLQLLNNCISINHLFHTTCLPGYFGI